MSLDKWQQDVLDTEGNMVLRSGRQVGKSYIIAQKAAQYAMDNPSRLIMVIAFTEKQANLLFSKILNNIVRQDKSKISKPKPTKHVIKLKNGSEIYCYAAGDTGYGIMGYTIDLLIADEAAWIKEEVWNSITPALAVTKGTMWLLSTPYISEGYYYECFNDPSFTSFHQSSEDCPRISEEFLEEKRRRFTAQQYSQMYLGEFVDDFRRVFSDEWIDQVCTLPEINNGGDFLGVDVAGMGEDESTFEGLKRTDNILKQTHHEVTTKTRTTDTTKKILDLDQTFNFDKIGIDSGGMGVGVFDQLLINDQTRYKVVALNNAVNIEVDKEGKTQKHKEAMYANLIGLGERQEIKLFDRKDIKMSLRSIQMEENGRISGRYSHIVEGIIRSAWLGKDKDLNMRVYSINIDGRR